MSPLAVAAFALALSVVIPVLAIVWLAGRPSATKTHLTVKTLAVGTLVAALYVGGVWSMTSHHLRYVMVLLFVAAAVFAWWRAHEATWSRPASRGEWFSVGAGVVVLASFGFLLSQVMGASRVPPDAVELDFPFRDGRFEVGQGGSRPLMNGHLATRDKPLYRGQSWALDIVQLDRLGRRARGLYPRDLERYHIFGTPVYAPCAGTVHRTENGLPDHQPPDREPDIADAPGNFVQLACDGGFFVVLAHFRQGSIRVEVGERVDVGDQLGQIGNSGNTTEPHLHIGAQSGPGEAFLLEADPLPMVFHGHGFLKRNDVVRVR